MLHIIQSPYRSTAMKFIKSKKIKSFTVYYKEERITDVIFEDGYPLKFKIIKYDNSYKQPFKMKNCTLNDIYVFLESRCYENNRDELFQILEYYSLSYNDPWEWNKITHGTMRDDYLWIKWEGEDITYNDIKTR